MAKAALFSQPSKTPPVAAPNVEDFVSGPKEEDSVKLTVRLTTSLHRHLKSSCALTGESLQERIERLVKTDLELERANQRSGTAA